MASSRVNIGSGEEISIKELALTVARIVGYEGRFEHDLSKPDGTPRKLLDTSRIEALGWQPRIRLEDGLRDVYPKLAGRNRRLRRRLKTNSYSCFQDATLTGTTLKSADLFVSDRRYYVSQGYDGEPPSLLHIKLDTQNIAGLDFCSFIGRNFLIGPIYIAADGENQLAAHIGRGNLAGGFGDLRHGLKLGIAAPLHPRHVEINFCKLLAASLRRVSSRLAIRCSTASWFCRARARNEASSSASRRVDDRSRSMSRRLDLAASPRSTSDLLELRFPAKLDFRVMQLDALLQGRDFIAVACSL